MYYSMLTLAMKRQYKRHSTRLGYKTKKLFKCTKLQNKFEIKIRTIRNVKYFSNKKKEK